MLARHFLVIFFTIVLFMPVVAQVTAQKTLLRVKVVDPNHATIPGADIWVSGGGLASSSAITDRNGEFSLMLEPGEYDVRVLAEGFSEVTEKVNLSTSSQPFEIV